MSPQPSSAAPRHVPVLPAEVLDALAPAPGQTIVDATVGAGGHARLIAERLGPTGRLIGLDQDASMLDLARARLAGYPVTLVQSNFDELATELKRLGIEKVDGILADLGVCSDQMDAPDRGFSFQQPGPLDMRMDATLGEPASSLLARLSEHELADVFWQYGEERFSRRIAQNCRHAPPGAAGDNRPTRGPCAPLRALAQGPPPIHRPRNPGFPGFEDRSER